MCRAHLKLGKLGKGEAAKGVTGGRGGGDICQAPSHMLLMEHLLHNGVQALMVVQ